jgi:cytosine deaminase
MSGTLFEGIARWSQRKASVTVEDTRQRALKTIGMLRDNGVQHVRTHIDVTDPSLTALEAMLAVKKEAAQLIDLQIVAFPQEGIESFPGGRELMTRAIEMGADVVGGIPHYENTRDKGVSSLGFLMDLAQRHGCLVDVHCDEIDDPQSRFLEVLAEEARVRGMGAQVTASHTCAMGSYDNAYCSKLFRLLKASGINFISCPTEHSPARTLRHLAETSRRNTGGRAGPRRDQRLFCAGLHSGSVVSGGQRQHHAYSRCRSAYLPHAGI